MQTGRLSITISQKFLLVGGQPSIPLCKHTVAMYYTGILLYYSKVKQKLNSFRKRGFVVNLMSKTEFPLVPATARVRLVYFLKFRKL